MSMKTVKVPDWFHEWIEAEIREGETYWEALVRMTGGPSPERVAGVLSDETATEMRDLLDATDDADRESQREVLDRLDESP